MHRVVCRFADGEQERIKNDIMIGINMAEFRTQIYNEAYCKDHLAELTGRYARSDENTGRVVPEVVRPVVIYSHLVGTWM